jgi:hypothetical protein
LSTKLTLRSPCRTRSGGGQPARDAELVRRGFCRSSGGTSAEGWTGRLNHEEQVPLSTELSEDWDEMGGCEKHESESDVGADSSECCEHVSDTTEVADVDANAANE